MTPETSEDTPTYSNPGHIAVALIQGRITPKEARRLLAALIKNPVTVVIKDSSAENIGISEDFKPPATDKKIKGTKPK